MSGYDKSPDYAPQGGRWTAVLWIAGVLTAAVASALYAITYL